MLKVVHLGTGQPAGTCHLSAGLRTQESLARSGTTEVTGSASVENLVKMKANMTEQMTYESQVMSHKL